MTRREIIGLLGAVEAMAVLPWLHIARAQQAGGMRRVGVLYPLNANDPEAQARSEVFEQSLQKLGWKVGQDLQIDVRPAGGAASRIRQDAAELVALAPDVHLATRLEGT